MSKYVHLAADLVKAYVANNVVPVGELPNLIASIYAALSSVENPQPVEVPQRPAVNPKKSIHRSHIVCLEDGRKLKSLRLHLEREHGLTPEEYRAKWDLPETYPMVAPDYAARRSEIALKTGLGIRPTPRRLGTGKRR